MHSRSHLPSRRRGVTLLELLAAATLLLAIFATVPPMLATAARIERSQTAKRVAVQELANVQQRILSLAADRDGKRLADAAIEPLLAVRPALEPTLGKATIAADREPIDDRWERLTLSLTWTQTTERTVSLASLLPRSGSGSAAAGEDAE